MKLGKEWHPVIRRLYRKVRRGPYDGPYGFRRLALETGMLPLCADMSGFTGVDLAGEIKSGLYDGLPAVTVETDERIINSALFQASKLYPDLTPLVPEWPDDAFECPHCNGTGIPVGIPTEIQKSVVCYCGGLGWIPNGS